MSLVAPAPATVGRSVPAEPSLALDVSPVTSAPTRQKKTICLVMIVKNEAATIRRCLDSVKPVIDYWIICDTGSTDCTKETIQDSLKNIPGELHDDLWVDFAHNRNLALSRARRKADYQLLINADETLNFKKDFRADLTDDAYLIGFTGDTDYAVPTIVSDRHDWKYEGATHEYIHAETAKSFVRVKGVSLTHHYDGGSRGNKYQRDLETLSRAVEQEPENVRYMFYLAQTYRESGLCAQALDWYAKRAEAGGWDEEVFYSLYQIARLQHASTLPWPTIMNSYLLAYQFRPVRIEPLFHIVKHYRERQHYQLAYLFGKRAIEVPYPEDILFIERNIYDYELPLEFGICCYHLRRHQEAMDSYDRILQCPTAPSAVIQAATRNRQLSQFAQRAL